MSFTPLDLQVNFQSMRHLSNQNAHQQSFAQAEAARENDHLKKETELKDSKVEKAKENSESDEARKLRKEKDENEDPLFIDSKQEGKKKKANKSSSQVDDENTEQSDFENSSSELKGFFDNHVDIKA